ncbi:TetR/AcrR family transcriptional regulator [Desulfospira joergensenii]|uniref:TetR/AcrR family transcriptional regulator n=1 Tax=Desulfospira joergensenii TaxID=53329 RepID=UPI0003B30F8E|nr:TetR/AcrR family transcriptional regulator [Desulfospira joergensenii]
MRIKDDNKKKALFKATIKLVNEIGFSAASVSKIAKEAEVSPATLYTYYKNKEDLLVSTYLEIKQDMSRAALEGFDDSLPLRDILEKTWLKLFRFISDHPDYYRFSEQFASSPFSERVDQEKVEYYFVPLIRALEKGIRQKIIKDVDRHFLGAFMFHPISYLANHRVCRGFDLDDHDLETAFSMAWDAVKF